jgi:hypothetical protein
MKKSHYIFCLIIVLISCNNTADRNSFVKTDTTEAVIDSNLVFLNILKNTVWISDGIVGIDRTKNKYKLTKAPDKMGKWAGNMTSFDASNQFTSFYSAFCGNDCFTKAFGHYKFITPIRFALSVDSITYAGECKKPTERFLNPMKQVFQIETQKDTIYLIKK